VAAIEGWQLYVAHLGDSRAYLIRNNVIHSLTVDHTWVQQALDAGRLSEADAKLHPNRHTILRHLGVARGLEIDRELLAFPSDQRLASRRMATSLSLEPGDAILLCSDGVTEKVKDEEILAIVKANKEQPKQAVRQLVQCALDREEGDNITAVLLVMPEIGLQGLVNRTGLGVNAFSLLSLVVVALLLGGAWWVLGNWQGGQPPSAGIAAAATPLPPTSQPLATATVVEQTVVESTPPTATLVAMTLATRPVTLTRTMPLLLSVSPTWTLVAPSISGTLMTSETLMHSGTLAIERPTAATVMPTPIPLPATTVLPTAKPTSTRLATPTVLPTPTATATNVSAAPVATAKPVADATVGGGSATLECASCSVTLLAPLEPVLGGEQTFNWQANNFELGTAYLFEMVLWADGQDALRDGRSPIGAGRSTNIKLSLDSAASALTLKSGAKYHWGVLLVDANDARRRIKYLQGDHRFELQLNTPGNEEQGDDPETKPTPIPKSP